jgi:hypothetical protein
MVGFFEGYVENYSIPLSWLLVASGVSWFVEGIFPVSSHHCPGVVSVSLPKFLFIRTPGILD